VIYSDTAAANYPAGIDIFKVSAERIPFKRCGTPEEVIMLM